MKRAILFAAGFTMTSSAAFALNKIEGIKIDPARIKAGSSVTITVSGDETQNNNCGLRINYGDGQSLDVKVVEKNQFPHTVTHAYANPGNYTVSVEGKKVTTHFGCLGNAKATLTVEAPPPPPAPPPPATPPATVPAPTATPAAKAVGVCPAGYQGSYVQQDSSYGCRPTPNATATKAVCPDGYQASLAAKDGSFQCKPIPTPAKPVPKPRTKCPANLIYFENPDGEFGCRKPAGK